MRAVSLTARARADLGALSAEVARRISRRILGQLGQDPAPRGDTIKRLIGFDPALYRLRVGDWRAIFRVRGTEVFVLAVVHRSELERELRTLV